MPPKPSTSAASVVTGALLAERYALERLLARGGMADVYRAHDRQLERPVAVKVYRAAETSDRRRFDAEVELLAGLNHPNLVAVYDAGEHGGTPFMVLELVEGPTLAAQLAQHGPRPAEEVARLGAGLAGALAHVHARGVVHRDLTPANVLCGPDGGPKLTDFGIARVLDTARMTAEHLTVGTAGYLAPEQVLGGDVTPAADVYALGLVLLEAITGAAAFEGSSNEVVVARLARDPAVPPDLPEPWAGLLPAMTARSAEERPTAAEVAQQLLSGTAEVSSKGAAAKAAPVVAPPSGDRADPHATTRAMASVQPAPPPAEPTRMMPVPLRPDSSAEPDRTSDAAVFGGAPTPGPPSQERPPRGLGALVATSSTALESAGMWAVDALRRIGPTAWAMAAIAAIVALAISQGGGGGWW